MAGTHGHRSGLAGFWASRSRDSWCSSWGYAPAYSSGGIRPVRRCRGSQSRPVSSLSYSPTVPGAAALLPRRSLKVVQILLRNHSMGDICGYHHQYRLQCVVSGIEWLLAADYYRRLGSNEWTVPVLHCPAPPYHPPMARGGQHVAVSGYIRWITLYRGASRPARLPERLGWIHRRAEISALIAACFYYGVREPVRKHFKVNQKDARGDFYYLLLIASTRVVSTT